MPRVKRSINAQKKRRKVLERGQGLLGTEEVLVPAGQRAAASSPAPTRIATAVLASASSAACGSRASTPARRQNGLSYNQLIHGLKAGAASRWTARSWPTWLCASPRSLPRWPLGPRKLWER